MSAKIKPRWGEIVVSDVEDFALSPESARELAAMLDVTDAAGIERIARDLNEVGLRYRLWFQQDEAGPSRAERNAALEAVHDASTHLEQLLGALDHASESDLMDALTPYRAVAWNFGEAGHAGSARGEQEFGFRQIEALRHRLAHFNRGIGSFLKRRRGQRGPDRRKTLPAIVDVLADIYEDETGKPVTHTPFKKTEYVAGPQSPAGLFIAAFIKCIEPKLPQSAVSSTLAAVVKLRKQRNKRDCPPVDRQYSLFD